MAFRATVLLLVISSHTRMFSGYLCVCLIEHGLIHCERGEIILANIEKIKNFQHLESIWVGIELDSPIGKSFAIIFLNYKNRKKNILTTLKFFYALNIIMGRKKHYRSILIILIKVSFLGTKHAFFKNIRTIT